MTAPPARPFPAKPTTTAVVGGGRWARQIASVLDGLGRPGDMLTVCSPSAPGVWERWMAERTAATPVTIAPSLKAVLDDPAISHVLIARAARDNAATAIAALDAGKAVFVEKPFALTLADADAVIAAAADRVAMTGLVFLFATNLRRFAAAVAALGAPTAIEIGWADGRGERRHGDAKGYDPTINVAQDVLPHVLSLLHLLVPGPVRTDDIDGTLDVRGGGRDLRLRLDAAGVPAVVTMTRDAPARLRRIRVSTAQGEAELDFTREPGTARVGDVALDVATGFTSPLRAELVHFLDLTPERCAVSPAGVWRARAAIELAADLLPMIRTARARAIAAGAVPTADTEAFAAAQYALREEAGDIGGR